jgi:hypothetical protein
MPEKTSYSSSADKHKFSQGKAEVIDMSEHRLRRLTLDELQADIPGYLDRILLEHDFDIERRLRETGRDRDVKFISCKGLVANKTLMEQMKRLLRCIQDEYDYPVDTEFTINISESGEYSVDLLQCRPLQVQKTSAGTVIPQGIPEERILLESKGSTMGMSGTSKLDIIVYVDPVAYYHMPYADKPAVAKMVGRVNWHFRDQDKRMLLITPGRICTSSPELGVPTEFSDISEFDTILELADRRAGYMPELSYGSHIFQDLVEAEILYSAVFEGASTRVFREQELKSGNELMELVDLPDGLENVIYLHQIRHGEIWEYYDLSSERFLVARRTPSSR